MKEYEAIEVINRWLREEPMTTNVLMPLVRDMALKCDTLNFIEEAMRDRVIVPVRFQMPNRSPNLIFFPRGTEIDLAEW